MNYNRHRLFQEQRLDDYLESLSNKFKSEIKSFGLDKLNQEEHILIKMLTQKYSVQAPAIDDNSAQIKAEEALIRSNGSNSGIDFEDRIMTVNGLSLIVEIPFEGNAQLFQCAPSRSTLSGTPNADIKDRKIILCYETAEKDIEKIKSLWTKDIQAIKDHLNWIDQDLLNYNNCLLGSIKTALQKRKKEAEDNLSIINKLNSNV